jgi:hypothetical protein
MKNRIQFGKVQKVRATFFQAEITFQKAYFSSTKSMKMTKNQ